MNWSLYRWVWRLDAPLFIGMPPAGTLNRCRLYAPVRPIWGALTAELAQRQAQSFPAYSDVGERLRKECRFTYMYPAENVDGTWLAWLPSYEKPLGLVWYREDRVAAGHELSDRDIRRRLLHARPGTAIDPSSDTTHEETLRETECIGPYWNHGDGRSESMALVGYILSRAGENFFDAVMTIDSITVGGDTRYGLGRLRRMKVTESNRIFGNQVRLNSQDPEIESARIFAHAEPKPSTSKEILSLLGEVEALAGWDYGKSGIQHFAGSVWRPGSRTEVKQRWLIKENGCWVSLGASSP